MRERLGAAARWGAQSCGGPRTRLYKLSLMQEKPKANNVVVMQQQDGSPRGRPSKGTDIKGLMSREVPACQVVNAMLNIQPAA